jgi:hypothetical protein
MTEAVIGLADVSLLIVELDYQVQEISDHLVVITNPETGLKMVGALNDEVIVFSCKLCSYEGTLADFVAKNPGIVADILAGNGDINAKFILAEENGVTSINLTKDVKLLELGVDDKDDIAYALSSLEQDAMFDSRDIITDLQ